MQYIVTRGGKGKIDVKVDVPKAGFEEAYGQTLDKLGAEAQIAGFRPGKVPRDILIGHVGSNKVLNQTASFLISKHLSDILEKEKFFPLDSPKIAIETLADASPFSFMASFTQKPEVKVGDWKSIKIKKVAAKEVTEKDVEESIKNIFEAWLKQQETKNLKQETEKTEGVEGSGKFIYDSHGNKVFFDKETLRSSSNQDSTAGLKIPDDEFAKAIGAKDLVHLKELVRKDLATIVADQVEAKLEQEVYEKIIEIGRVEIPDILVEDELNRILVRLSSELERQGSDLEKYLAEQKITIDELKTKWRVQAEKNVKITLVMDEIGRAEGVKVSPEEIETAMKGVSEQNLSADQKADLERYLALSIFQAKTLDLVKKAVTAS